ncbi:ABC transporter substrate-binding protein [Neptunomonas phycophila]|jgi:glycine betaine/proline transport system substrate-binding protein|uniref:ABC transporter substrate-binding protein n=1 Tax=Neptunomonas phycophila TaxID=1572645 RepID=A0AAW7XJ83_9GAMM|nr:MULTISPECIES: ABC transporter substrate-binding protein [Neptunomonas]MBT3147111.1 ABC transporter substrate-binding protein [Neptunomonas phycophila]MDN2658519.1 ABC transporter substrate-binding protein [Neptunomonas sp. CHC150]MDO6452910.1 ABC transporter substrate-binding protein [Neptunomonas phycophila]MDO6467444.1 ABC transporter substrate-binding protein [Neptunomonas phycophila]MDO6783439.1 ABC transporter substrate-binding protein [Neptunomonas phycophila]
MKKILAALPLIALGTSAYAADECGSVSIADMNWNSATLIAHVDKFILENGYGCDAELVPGDTMPTGASMIEKGEPDIAPEMWSNSMREALDKGVEEGRLRFAGQSLSDGGEEGFWVPKYMVDKDPTLATIAGVIAHAKEFEHPEDPELSAFYTCPAGWNCQISSGNLFEALKLADAGFDLVDPGSGAGLSGAIAKAYERQEPWFGYYWAPTAVLGKYEMVKVDFGSGIDEAEFKNCTTAEDCENPKVTMYPPSMVQTVTTEGFAKRAPEAYEYLANRAFTNAQMNGLLAWMEDNQADGDVAMEHFLTENADTWTAWVSEEAAAKIKTALDNL